MAGLVSLLASFTVSAQSEPPLRVTIAQEVLNDEQDRPSGAYQVADSQVLIRATQSGGGVNPGLAGMAGAAGGGSFARGALIAGAGSLLGKAAHRPSKRGYTQINFENLQADLRFRLDERLRSVIARQIAQRKVQDHLDFSEGGEGRQLSVAAQLILTPTSDYEVRASVEVKTTLPEPGSNELWTHRYFATNATPRPFKGIDSWTENSSAALDAAIGSGLEEAVVLMMGDLLGTYRRYDATAVTITGDFPLISQRIKVVASQVWEDEHKVAVLVKMQGKSVLDGIQLFDKSVVTMRPVESGDRFEIVE
jgi:hypothetical protein